MTPSAVMKKGKLIVIDGVDGTGKGTQAKLAITALSSRGTVELQDFPRYGESRAGELCGMALKGDLGDFRNLHPKLASLPYTLDRIGVREKIRDALTRGHVICNRYTPSNAMYQAAKLQDPGERKAFILWLEELEYEELQLPRPDLVIYLSVPFEVSRKLTEGKDARNYMGGVAKALDVHERDDEYLKEVAELYRTTASHRPQTWKVIECMQGETLRTPEDIHAEVMTLIDSL